VSVFSGEDQLIFCSSIIGGESNKILGNANHSLAFGESVSVSSDYVAAFFADSSGFYRGKVGINNPSPTVELEVNGSAKVTSNLEVDGKATINDVLHLTPGTAPVLPQRGDIYYDDSTDKVKVCTGEGPPVIWEDLN